jgi:hypothetical protein
MRPKLQQKPVPIEEPALTENELRRMVSEAAYYLAEKRGFAPGSESDDWRQAEQEVLARVRESQSRI